MRITLSYQLQHNIRTVTAAGSLFDGYEATIAIMRRLLQHTGVFKIIGGNTLLFKLGSPTIIPKEVIRVEMSEKLDQINTVRNAQII
ncbi:MAG: hypothetical protein AAF738_01405 [Bacteroidota bacterium]